LLIIIRKILAVFAMALCAAFLVVCLGGALGVWLARAPLTAAAVGLLTSAHDTLQRADALAGDVEGGLSEIATLASQVRGTAADVSEAAGVLKEIGPIGRLLSSVTDGTAKLESRLIGVEGSAKEMRAELGVWIAFSDRARQRVSAWITAGVIGITLGLLWFGAGQASLFVHALWWFRRPG
jgi:hypothetical protein